jgi:uncharacterized protein (UPF0248 family)
MSDIRLFICKILSTAFEIIQNNVQLQYNTREDYKIYMKGGKGGAYGSNVKTIVISEIYKICQCFFVYDGQITQPLPVAVIKL